jgi:hypothetical protein
MILGFPGCLLLLPPALSALAALVVATALLVLWPIGLLINAISQRRNG